MIDIDDKQQFELHYYGVEAMSGRMRSFYAIGMPLICDVLPIVFETTFNILSVILIRNYIKNKLKMISKYTVDTETTKKIEIKLTILVIFMSTLSTM
jgi:hypothetical protein